MALKHYNPTTPGQRQLVLVDKSDLHKGKPEKTLVVGLKKTGGRNNTGRITTRHIGGGHKRSYRLVDFKRNKYDLVAEIQTLEYDPNRTAFIALIKYEDGKLSYILAPQGLEVGDKVVSSAKAEIKVGNTLPLLNIPVGSILHNIELKVGKGGQLARSAGAYAQLIVKDRGYAQLRLSSGELRLVNANCLATLGVVSNIDHRNVSSGKAGRSRWLGVRPTVRGTAMNPVDHPHGGGQGKTSGGRHPVTPWGKPTKGKRTRTNKSTSKFIIRRRYDK
ncbi:50S ribosomal protein L2 [Candidatus Hepatincolaceae symbiont of Richtersius coronifer]